MFSNRNTLLRALPLIALTVTITNSICQPAYADKSSWRKLEDQGTASFKRGDYPDALKSFAEALEQASGYEKSEEDRATTLNDTGLVYDELKQREQAQKYYQDSLEAKRKAFGTDHYALVSTMNNLAFSYISEKRYDEAVSVLKESIAIVEKAKGANDPALSVSLNRLAGVYQTTKKYQEAVDVLTRSLEIAKKASEKRVHLLR